MPTTTAVRFKITEGHEEDTLKALQRYAEEGVPSGEPGLVFFEIFKVRDSDIYFCLEEFADQAAIDDHAVNIPKYLTGESLGSMQNLVNFPGQSFFLLAEARGKPRAIRQPGDSSITVLNWFEMTPGYEKAHLESIAEFGQWIAENEPGTGRWDVYKTEVDGVYICIEDFDDEEAMNKHALSSARHFGDPPPEEAPSTLLGQDFGQLLIKADR